MHSLYKCLYSMRGKIVDGMATDEELLDILAEAAEALPSHELPQVPGRAPVTSQEPGSRPAVVTGETLRMVQQWRAHLDAVRKQWKGQDNHGLTFQHVYNLAQDADALLDQFEHSLALALDHIERDTKEIERLHGEIAEARRNADDWMQKYGSTQGQSSSKAAPIFRTGPEIRWCNSDEGICGHPTVFDLLQDAEEQLRADKDAAGIDMRINEVPLVKALLSATVTPDRNAVIEECAQLCERIGKAWDHPSGHPGMVSAEPRGCAAAIRALKTSVTPDGRGA